MTDENTTEQSQVETTSINGRVYTIDSLRQLADSIVAQEIPLAELADAVSQGNTYWIDRAGNHIGPHDMVTDWPAAQQNPAWADHVASIERANLDEPIWMTEDGAVFDGMHRLTRAFLDGKKTIKVKIFTALP